MVEWPITIPASASDYWEAAPAGDRAAAEALAVRILHALTRRKPPAPSAPEADLP